MLSGESQASGPLSVGHTTMLSAEGTSSAVNELSPMVRRYADYMAHADVRTAISEFIAHDMTEFWGIRPDFILPVGVDTKIFFPPPARDHPVPIILFVAHLIEREGPQFVLAAVLQFPQARFHLIGAVRDSFGENSRRRTAKLKLQNVTIEGPVPQPQLAEIMRASDILMLPSRMGGIPKVTLEAAATGLPCVVFADYKTPSVVDGSTGFQVDTHEQMLQRVGLLIEDEGYGGN